MRELRCVGAGGNPGCDGGAEDVERALGDVVDDGAAEVVNVGEGLVEVALTQLRLPADAVDGEVSPAGGCR